MIPYKIGRGILGLIAILNVLATRYPNPVISANVSASSYASICKAFIRMALATVMTRQHRAGPIMKIGAGFCDISDSLPSEMLYGLEKSKVNHNAPRIK